MVIPRLSCHRSISELRSQVIRIGDEHPEEFIRPRSQGLQENSAFEVYKKG